MVCSLKFLARSVSVIRNGCHSQFDDTLLDSNPEMATEPRFPIQLAHKFWKVLYSKNLFNPFHHCHLRDLYLINQDWFFFIANLITHQRSLHYETACIASPSPWIWLKSDSEIWHASILTDWKQNFPHAEREARRKLIATKKLQSSRIDICVAKVAVRPAFSKQ